jgi:hypothetical protein
MEGFSGAVSFEEIEIKNRTFCRCGWYELVRRRFRRRMRLSFLSKITMPENLGIILGFVLSFAAKFSMGPEKWKLSDWPIIFVALGIIVMIIAFKEH